MATRLWRRMLAGTGATALAMGLASVAPATAANATTVQSVSGAVSESAPGTWALGAQLYGGEAAGTIEVYTSGCSKVEGAVITWSGTRFRATVPKGGKYKLVYRDATGITKSVAPYGLAESWFGGGVGCTAAPVVAIGTGKKVTGKNIAVRAAGALQAVGATLKSTSTYSDRYLVYSAKTGQRMATLTSAYAVENLAPGSYRIAVGRYVVSTKKTTVLRVFGTSSKTVSRGKTVTVSSTKAVQANFGKSAAVTVRDFLSTRVALSGTGEIGSALKAKFTALPSATRISYQWSRRPGGSISGATGSSFTVRAADICTQLSVSTKLRKSGYLNRAFTSGSKTAMPPTSAVQTVWTCNDVPLVAEGQNGELYSGAQVGDTLIVTPASFAQAPKKVVFGWGIEGEPAELGNTSTFVIDPAYNGRTLQVTVTYSWSDQPDRVMTTSIIVDTTVDGQPLPDLIVRDPQTFEGDLSEPPYGADYKYIVTADAPLAIDHHVVFKDAAGEVMEVNDAYCEWSLLNDGGPATLIRVGSCMLSVADLEGVLAAQPAGDAKKIQLVVTYTKDGYQDYAVSTRFLVAAP